MSAGNLRDQGNQGKNTPYQIRVLQLLAAILAAGGGGGGGCCPSPLRTPTLLRTAAAGNIPAGRRSVSVFNAGMANGLWLGSIIKPGEQFSYDAGSTSDLLAAFAYDGSGTELVITTVG